MDENLLLLSCIADKLKGITQFIVEKKRKMHFEREDDDRSLKGVSLIHVIPLTYRLKPNCYENIFMVSIVLDRKHAAVT